MPQSNDKVRVVNNSKPIRTMRPALTEEADEQQMISLATDLAKRQLLDGTASSQVITHYLILGSSKKKLEAEIMVLQKDLLVAKTEALRSTKTIEELYSNAIRAMRVYSGSGESEDNNEGY
jgi:hypothetical protein